MEPALTDAYLAYAYNVLRKSTYDLAKQFDTYPNNIRRRLKDAGVQLRGKGEAQKEALESGRHNHPTKGKKRTEAERLKISESVAKIWENMSDEDRESRSKLAKENWDNMTTEERQNLKKKASDAVRKSAELGSKLERHLLVELQRNGYKVEFHREALVSNEKLEMDLFLPNFFPPVVIEVDGPAHFFPIWGQESLTKHLTSDKIKNGLLLESGYVVIRIKHLVKNLSEIHKRRVLAAVLETLDKLKTNKVNDSERLIEIEVK